MFCACSTINTTIIFRWFLLFYNVSTSPKSKKQQQRHWKDAIWRSKEVSNPHVFHAVLVLLLLQIWKLAEDLSYCLPNMRTLWTWKGTPLISIKIKSHLPNLRFWVPCSFLGSMFVFWGECQAPIKDPYPPSPQGPTPVGDSLGGQHYLQIPKCSCLISGFF